MNVKCNHSIQYVVACIATHSYWAEQFSLNYRDLKDYFLLSNSEYQILNKLLAEQGRRLTVNARIMEEKRFREVEQAMRYTVASQPDSIKLAWSDYLQQIPLVVAIPPTPTDEAILFINYLINSNKLSLFQKEVATYELYKNMALNFEFNDYINQELCEFNWYVRLNPSVACVEFKFDIPQFLNNVNLGKFVDGHSGVSVKNKQNLVVLFCKNRDTGSIVTMSIVSYIKILLSKLKPIMIFREFYNEIVSTLKINEDGVRNLLLKMRQNDVISFEMRGL